MSSLYRQSKLGDSLVEALDVMIKDQRVSAPLAYKVLEEFDAAMANALMNRINNRASFSGHLETYRYCDNVWTFVLSGAQFKFPPISSQDDGTKVDKLQIVCVDTRFVENKPAQIKTES